MKTLAVLSALATIAIAAPALEEYSNGIGLTSKDFTITQQREKKSTLPETPTEKSSEPSEDHSTAKTLSKLGSSNTIHARTFSGFKKPIIVKKKIGYHVYRDSDEEQAQADSRESCKKQIKVKLCDDNNSIDKMKTASIDHTQDEISESEIKNSINMAKEAVETFQRDLQKMEHASIENNGQRQNKFGDDKELHEDIEKARQALEHIQNKFKNFDSMINIRDQNMPDHQLRMIKSDEERMALWKLAEDRYKNFEVGRNLEDSFTQRNDVTMQDNTNGVKSSLKHSGEDIKSIATAENVDSRTTSSIKETNIGNGMISVVEDKETKMDIHSDNLKKENAVKDDIQLKKHTTMEQHNDNSGKNTNNDPTQLHDAKNSAECNDHTNMKNDKHASLAHKNDNVQGNKDGVPSLKSSELKEKNVDVMEKHTWDNVEKKDMLKSTGDSSVSTIEDHTKAKLENEMHNGLLKMSENDQVTHESKNIDTSSRTISKIPTQSDKTDLLNKDVTTQSVQTEAKGNLDHDKDVRSPLLEISPKDQSQNNMQHDDNLKQNQELMLQRSALKPLSLIKSEQQDLNHEASLHKPLKTDDAQRSTLSIANFKEDNENKQLHPDEHHDNGKINDHALPEHLRATSDFHKDVLNNMEFVDSHHLPIKKTGLEENVHKLKNENPQLLERHVPQVQPNPEHLQTMMHFSDKSPHINNQQSQLKMAPMFNNDQPNFNVQFNTPQTFEEQTNNQNLMPFKSAADVHEKDLLDKDVLSDPLKMHWAHENNMNSEKLKAASHIHQENMQTDGSSQHFSSIPFRMSTMDNKHLDLNDQINAQQRWAQAKNMNAHNLPGHDSLVSRNFDHSMMMQEKINMDNGMHPNSFMHMRGVPKMALEYSNPNQWNRNQAALRSSYGPSMSASYGSGGGPGSGGSAVGLFPNANVGNCAVPLLLSCSPSVVSGSLAKTNTYNAPSYRSEDINFVKKRNTDIGEVTPNVKTQRYTSLNNKPNVLILENKI